MEKIKVVVFGTLPLATKICELLLEHPKFDLYAVVLGKSNPVNIKIFDNTKCLKDFTLEKKIKSISIEELSTNFSTNFFDYGISCRYDKILKKNHIKKFRFGIINFHGGLLPEFGGLYSSCHTILEESLIGGGTLHFINEGIDTGEIIERLEFDVSQNDTSESIFKKTQISLYNGFKNLLPKIVNNSFTTISQESLLAKGHVKCYYDRNSINGKKLLKLDEDKKMIDKKIRAFDFPSFEPAYFIINNKRYYVRKSI